MSIIAEAIYTHYIEGEQVFPGGEWEIVHKFPEGCIFSRREFSGTLTFGNIGYNRVSDDYDYLIGFGEQYCQRLSYEIYCNNELYWEGYINHTLSYEVDEDNCTIKVTPLLLDEYDCFVLNGEIEYNTGYGETPFVGIDRYDVVLYDRGDGSPPYDTEGTLPDCLELQDMINNWIKSGYYMDCDFTGQVRSSFFWLDDYPDETTPTENYVTRAANPWDEIYLCSIAKARDALGSAESGTDWPEGITFNILMEFLKNFFNVYWYIDINGDFRLEHLHYFEHDFANRANTLLPDDLDLTAINNEYTGKPLDTFKNKWKYIENELPSQEVLEMTDAEGEDFMGLPIEYDIDCTYNYPKITIKEYSSNSFMTDVQMLIDDPDSVGSNGFLVIAATNMDVACDENDITGWTNDAVANAWTTWNSAGVNIQLASHTAPPATALAYSNDIGTTNIGDQYNLCFHIPAGGFAGTPTIAFYDAPGIGANLVSNVVNIVIGDTVTILTIGAGAPNLNTYLQIRGADGDQFGTVPDPAIFTLDEVDTTTLYCMWEEGAISGDWCNNGHLSVANLMDNYWRHGRVLDEGNMNGNAEVFDSIMPNRLQVRISIPKCCERLHWNTYMETDLGTGRIYKAAEKKYTHEVELLYE